MSANFDYAIPRVLRHEGGLVEHPDDPGGLTNMGISFRFARGLPEFEHHDDDDLRALISTITEDEARGVYRAHFWRGEYDQLHREVAYRVFDHSVNAGQRAAHRVAQRACRAHGVVLVEDGVLGPKTLSALVELGRAIVPALRSERAGFYRSLVAGNDSFEAFETGWLRRAYS